MIEVTNPYTGEIDFRFEAVNTDDLGGRCAALRAAQPAWQAAGLEARLSALHGFAGALERHREAIVDALAVDTGRRLLAEGELSSLLGSLARWCKQAPGLMNEASGTSAVPGLSYRNQWVPLPLVGVISPWNFPLVLAMIDAVPALLAGCAVIIKPSEVTPRFIAPLRRAIAEVEALAAVLALVEGDGTTGRALIGHVDAVCFTGSLRTGRRVAEAAAQALIPAFLELGGKDPVIVTGSADPRKAAVTVLRASVLATGQACQSLERVYVQRSLLKPFLDELVRLSGEVQLNWPDPSAGQLGPFIWPRQAEIVQAQLDEAVARGARVLCGGKVETHGGKWLRPTVLVDVDHQMAVMSEETFGPVMPVMAFDSEDEAIALANDSEYGLSAAVIAGNLVEAERIALRLEAGGVSLNDGSLTAVMHECEKHSFKGSGLGGSRMGPAGFTRFFRRKALIYQSGEPLSIQAFSERTR